ncbi:hypothetical protein [Geothrix sp.]|uniref:hypothetical protein n=1 Tax=Geothrix sp. TaxID=1962974 RepID=UPI0025BE8E55|nr:hypothetical protein [Geothrix sp.]
MRLILRAILTVVLLLGSGAGIWTPVQAHESHESCCCGAPTGIGAGIGTGMEDSCPCPKPEGNRGPAPSTCTERAAAVAAPTARRTQVERRTEPRPEPATWAQAVPSPERTESFPAAEGRDPDLGRHLARLSALRI